MGDEKTLWEREKGGTTYFVQLIGEQVVVGERWGADGMDEDATSVSIEAFVGGRLQDVVSTDLGPDVLIEVLRAISPTSPPKT